MQEEAVVKEQWMEKRNEVIMYIAGNSNSLTFHIRSHQQSNWESEGDAGCRASQQEKSRTWHRDLIKTQSRPQPEHTLSQFSRSPLYINTTQPINTLKSKPHLTYLTKRTRSEKKYQMQCCNNPHRLLTDVMITFFTLQKSARHRKN